MDKAQNLSSVKGVYVS